MGGQRNRHTLGGDGSQGEYYGEMAGSGAYYVADIMTGAKGTIKVVQMLKKAQWTRGTFQAANTTIQMEELVGYQTNNELIANISKYAVGYYYNAKSAIEEFANDLFH